VGVLEHGILLSKFEAWHPCGVNNELPSDFHHVGKGAVFKFGDDELFCCILGFSHRSLKLLQIFRPGECTSSEVILQETVRLVKVDDGIHNEIRLRRSRGKL